LRRRADRQRAVLAVDRHASRAGGGPRPKGVAPPPGDRKDRIVVTNAPSSGTDLNPAPSASPRTVPGVTSSPAPRVAVSHADYTPKLGGSPLQSLRAVSRA